MNSSQPNRRFYKILGTLFLCILSFGAGIWASSRLKSADEQLIDLAYRNITRDSLFNQQNQREISYAAIRGMLGVIEDPYAELIEPAAAQNFTSTFSGQTGVVGLYAEKIGQQVVISIVFPNGSAHRAGLQAGDVILAIDGMDLDQDTDSSEAGLMIRGAPGTSVHLKILRDGQVMDFDLPRQVREYVSYRMLPDGIGYIALTAFNQTASEQMKAGLSALLELKPAGLIWDLRNNEGGDMQAAQEILSYFIPDGLLFTADMTQDRTYRFEAKGEAFAADISLVVLMDQTTYSAAETCAAAIAETGRGKTIGSTSYGKGVIQATIPLLDNTLLQMTVARWRSPGGEWYHERGVPPQIEVVDDPATSNDELIARAISLLLNR
jgi:carboxyl-terminal processing protease